MADAADIEPEVPEQRTTRKLANAGEGEKDEVQKVADESSVHDSKTENVAAGESAGEEKKKSSKLKEMWGKLGLDVGTLMMMFKGSVAPTIAIAFYQADSVAETYSTLGYLVAIISVIAMPIMPRAKYFQTLVLNVLGICVGSPFWVSGLEFRLDCIPLHLGQQRRTTLLKQLFARSGSSRTSGSPTRCEPKSQLSNFQ